MSLESSALKGNARLTYMPVFFTVEKTEELRDSAKPMAENAAQVRIWITKSLSSRSA